MPERKVFATIGARNIALTEREKDDFYATDPHALELVLPQLDLSPNVWECACGMGHLSEVLKAHGHNVLSTDLVDRGYGTPNIDFLDTHGVFDGDIVTNPPYTLALDFVQKALDVVTDGHKVVMFLKIQFLEGQKRRKFFDENPPEFIYVSSSRIQCPMSGDFTYWNNKQSAMCFAWFVWRKGFKGEPRIRWFN